MKTENKRNGLCQECSGWRTCEVLGLDSRNLYDDETCTEGSTIDTRLLKCRGCGTIFMQEARYSIHSDDDDEDVKYKHWPEAEKRARPSWANSFNIEDADLLLLLHETYAALNNELKVLTAVGIRTSFDRASELLGVDPAITFEEKLEQLYEEGKIGGNERQKLEVLVDAGSAAAHRGWKPNLNQLETLISILEHFIHQNLVLTAEADELRKKVPPKPARKAPRKKKKTNP